MANERLTMDFFESQDAARRNTKKLVVLFVLAVISIIASVYIAFVLIFIGVDRKAQTRAGVIQKPEYWQPQLFLLVAGGNNPPGLYRESLQNLLPQRRR